MLSKFFTEIQKACHSNVEKHLEAQPKFVLLFLQPPNPPPSPSAIFSRFNLEERGYDRAAY